VNVAALAARLRAAGSVFAEDEARLLLAADGDLETLVRRRLAGEPLETVVGWAEFCGLRIVVEPGVFVPRRRTELLAREAAALVRPGSVVVDLCCGTGAIATAVAHLAPGAELHAADLDPRAVACARRNVEPVGGSVWLGDLFAALPGRLAGRIDVLAVNAPYVPTEAIATMPPEARDHEARLALDGGDDGLEVHRRVARDAAGWLAPGGTVLIETSTRQASSTAALLADAGLAATVRRDAEVDGTVAIGTLAIGTAAIGRVPMATGSDSGGRDGGGTA
jgi:release factor glutamine methyltransferase